MLERYADGDLPADKIARTKDHIVSCAACARKLAEIKSLKAHLGELDYLTPDAHYWTEFEDRLLERIRSRAAKAERTGLRSAISFPTFALISVVALMSVILAYVVFSQAAILIGKIDFFARLLSDGFWNHLLAIWLPVTVFAQVVLVIVLPFFFRKKHELTKITRLS